MATAKFSIKLNSMHKKLVGPLRTDEELHGLMEESARISSTLTVFIKVIWPSIFLMLFLLCLLARLIGADVSWLLSSLPAAIGLALWFDGQKFVDAVFDGGSSLIFQNGKVIEEVPLTNIQDIKWYNGTRMTRVKVILDKPIRLGREIQFIKGINLDPRTKHLGTELLERMRKS